MDKLWTDEAWKDFLNLHSDKRLVKKLDSLLKDIDRTVTLESGNLSL